MTVSRSLSSPNFEMITLLYYCSTAFLYKAFKKISFNFSLFKLNNSNNLFVRNIMVITNKRKTDIATQIAMIVDIPSGFVQLRHS